MAYRGYLPTYRKYLEVDTFALSEDIKLGPDYTVGVQYANPILGYTSAFIGPYGSFAYTWDWQDDLATVGASYRVRYQPEVNLTSSWVYQVAGISARNVSPRLGFFRLIVSGRLVEHVDDLDRNLETLGGDGALRGYPSNYLLGTRIWGANVEARSVPFEFHTIHYGGVVFLDMGDAFNDPVKIGIHGSVGLGLRVVFPQFNRSVLRVDFGVPLEKVLGSSSGAIVAKFGQAFF